MTQNNINEWEELTNINHIIALAVESSFVAYKESDTEAMEEILKNALQRIKELKTDDWAYANLQMEKKLDRFERDALVRRNLASYIGIILTTLMREVQDYEEKKLREHFGINF